MVKFNLTKEDLYILHAALRQLGCSLDFLTENILETKSDILAQQVEDLADKLEKAIDAVEQKPLDKLDTSKGKVH